MLSVVVKDTTEQTRGVLGALADRYNGHHGEPPDLAPWQALQEWLELAGTRDVTIPFAHELAKLSKARAVRLRRDFGKVLTLIQAHAMLHQAHRERDAQGRIVATLADYAAVHELVNDIINEGVEATVSATVRETVEAVAELRDKALADAGDESAAKPVTVAAVARVLKLDSSAASRRIAAARQLGYIVNEETRYRQPARLVLGEAMPGEESVLPTPEGLQEECLLLDPSERRAHVHTVHTPAPVAIDRARLQELLDNGYTQAEAEYVLMAETAEEQIPL